MIGIDAVSVDRFRAALARSPGLEQRLFTAAERAYCRSKADPPLHLAGTLAAKEAVIKARRLGSLAVWSRRIEILRHAGGAPWSRVVGYADPMHVSISHDGPVAVAVALGDPASLRTVDPDVVLGRRNEDLARYVGRSPTSGGLPQRSLSKVSLLPAGSDFP